MLLFEWDPNKNRKNIKTHGISFDEASTAFRDTLSLTISDPLHSNEEERQILIGNTSKNRLLVIVHTERGDKIRIISARKAGKKERKQYEENAKRSRYA
ncbi:MAG: BrnT family toxin [Nitrospirota bacterium]